MKSLNYIFSINIIALLLLISSIYFFIDYLIEIDFKAIKDIESLEESIKMKFILAITLTVIFSVLIGNRLISQISKELKKVESYLDNRFRDKKISLNYSIEFSKLAKKISRLRKKKLKYNAKLKIINYQQEKLLGAISHELKNPMSSILGYSQILKDEFMQDSNISNIHINFLNKIINNGKRIDELLNRLRLAVQLDNNKFELQYRIFNLTNSVKNVVENLAENEKRKIQIEVSNYELYADKTLIELVIINLIENGLKYSDGDIIVKLENNFIKVIDFGIGIKDTELSSVTKRFYRINRDSHKQSIGLGLAIVTYILKLHNLKLQINSKIGSGSEFSINLLGIKNRTLPKEIQPI